MVDKVVVNVFAAQRGLPDRSKRVKAEMQRIELELSRFMTLIADGNAPDRILEEVRYRERRRSELAAGLEGARTPGTRSNWHSQSFVSWR